MRLSPEMADLLFAYDAPHDIFAAALLGHVDHLRGLLDAQPTLVRAADTGGSTPLHLAAWTGQWEAVQLLVQRGAALNARDARGETPLAAGRPLQLRCAGARYPGRFAGLWGRVGHDDRAVPERYGGGQMPWPPHTHTGPANLSAATHRGRWSLAALKQQRSAARATGTPTPWTLLRGGAR